MKKVTPEEANQARYGFAGGFFISAVAMAVGLSVWLVVGFGVAYLLWGMAWTVKLTLRERAEYDRVYRK